MSQRTYSATRIDLLCAAAATVALTAGDATLADVIDAVRDESGSSAERARIPEAGDWVDRGPIFEQGGPGAWDHILWGGFAGTVVKRGGVFFLYYQGSRGYDDERGTVTDRAIGVATSHDGVRFEKSPANPVLTWQPNDGPEEGAVSSAAVIGSAGQTIFFYGANTEIDEFSVHADARMATSVDGIVFADGGIVLKHDDSSVWGFGDELFPVLAIADHDYAYVYYLPNGSRRSGHLGVAWGPLDDTLRWSGEVLVPADDLKVWGTASAVRLGKGRYALFLNQDGLQVRLVDLERPWRLSEVIRSYEFENVASAFVLHDEQTRVWYLYYQAADFSGYGVRVATLRD